MRRSFPTTFALAALAGVVVCGAASAAMNNSNSSTPVLTTTIKTKAKLPAGPTATTSSPTKKATTTATPTSAVSSTNATATAPATPSTASNSSSASTGGKPANQSGLPPAVQLRQDITRQQTNIKKSENYIVRLRHLKLNPAELLGRLGPTNLHPVFRYQIPGGPLLEFTFHFDGAGRMLPGEMDRFNRAARIAIDQTIVAETQRAAAAKKKLAADLAALGGQD